MRHERISGDGKGWVVGPWNSDLGVSVGFANEGVDEPHVHSRVTEIYLVTAGSASIRVEGVTIEVESGDVLVVEPGEAHSFLSSSPDYRHFVVHAPGLAGAEAKGEKRAVPRSRLGL